MSTNRSKRIWTVTYNCAAHPSGTETRHFKRHAHASAFAAGRLCYGEPARLVSEDVPPTLYARWHRTGLLR
jgi:hypothetical protein